MIQNRIQFIIDESGRHLRVAPFGSVRAFTDAAAVIELITPFPPESYIEIAYNVYDSRDIRLSQFLLPTTDRGADVISPTDDLYQKCADWSVFRVAIKATALTYIAKFRAGRVGVAFNVSDFVRIADMETYKGEFGDTPLPSAADEGDYYICNSYNYHDKGFLWNKGSAAYYKGEWKKAGRKARMTTATLDIPVDASVLADAPQIAEDDYDRIIGQLGAEIVAINQSKQTRLCPGPGINLSPGESCDTISLQSAPETWAGLKAIPILLSDWTDGEIVITPAQHGMGANPNLMVSTYTVDGEVYDSPEVDNLGNITLRADVQWEGKVLIAGGLAEKGEQGNAGNGIDRIELVDTVDLVDHYTIYYTDGTTKSYEVTNGEKGDPSTLDKIASEPLTTEDNNIIITEDGSVITLEMLSPDVDLGDRQNALFGTWWNPIEIDVECDIVFSGYIPQPGYQKSILLYIRRTADVAVTWQNITGTDWVRGEIPLLPVGKVQKILIETIDGEHYCGTGGPVK